MYRFSIDRDGTTIAELDRKLVPSVPKGKILETLESLYGRSLIEKNLGRFTQQPVVMEYITDRLIETAIAEICQQAPQILFTHALIEAQAAEYIRASQRKTILTPLLDRLASQLGDRATLIQLFHQNLALLQPQNRQVAIDPLNLYPLGYGAGNFINLLCHLQQERGSTRSRFIPRNRYYSVVAMRYRRDCGISQRVDRSGRWIYQMTILFLTGWNITTGECLQVLRPDRIYEGMNIAGAIGLAESQRATLKALGAVE